MKTSLTALAAILLTVGMAHAQDSAAAKPDEAATKLLIANERALQDAVGKADKSAFESLVLLSDGFWTMRAGSCSCGSCETHSRSLSYEVGHRQSAGDLAERSVDYTWTGTGTLFDRPVPRSVRRHHMDENATKSGSPSLTSRPRS